MKNEYYSCLLGNGTIFTLTSVTVGDAGIYTCSAKNFDVRSANVTVDVQCKNILAFLLCFVPFINYFFTLKDFDFYSVLHSLLNISLHSVIFNFCSFFV